VEPPKPTLAQALYPNLPSAARPEVRAQPEPTKWQPKPDFRDWSDVPPEYARLLGLVPKGRR